MLAAYERDRGRSLRRPAHERRFPHQGPQLSEKALMGAAWDLFRGRHEGSEGFRGRLLQGPATTGLELVGQALAHRDPIAKIFGQAPLQADPAFAQFAGMPGSRGQVFLRPGPFFAGKHQQKLTAPAGAQQNAREAHLRQKRPGQNFAE